MSRSQKQVTMSQMVQVTQLNPLGRVHGGEMIKMMDNAAACAASRYSGQVCVTVALDNVDFHDAIYAGEVAVCEASIAKAGRSSMRVEVVLKGENLLTGESRLVTTATFTMVAVDHNGNPVRIPAMAKETAPVR